MSSLLPLPKNKKEYLPSEVIAIANMLSHTINRSKLIDCMINKKLVPVSKASLYRLFKKSDNGISIRDTWEVGGRPPLMDQDDLLKIKDELNTFHGLTVDTEFIKKRIQQSRIEKIEKSGNFPLSMIHYTPSRTTVSNYRATEMRTYIERIMNGNTVSDGVKLMYKMVTEVHGNLLIIPVHPGLILSTAVYLLIRLSELNIK